MVIVNKCHFTILLFIILKGRECGVKKLIKYILLKNVKLCREHGFWLSVKRRVIIYINQYYFMVAFNVTLYSVDCNEKKRNKPRHSGHKGG